MANKILIKELSRIAEWFEHQAKVGYHGDVRDYEDAAHTIMSAVELLKEQEAVEPITMNHTVFGTSRKCSKCNRALFPAGFYCPHCGRPVEWE